MKEGRLERWLGIVAVVLMAAGGLLFAISVLTPGSEPVLAHREVGPTAIADTDPQWPGSLDVVAVDRVTLAANQTPDVSPDQEGDGWDEMVAYCNSMMGGSAGDMMGGGWGSTGSGISGSFLKGAGNMLRGGLDGAGFGVMDSLFDNSPAVNSLNSNLLTLDGPSYGSGGGFSGMTGGPGGISPLMGSGMMRGSGGGMGWGGMMGGGGGMMGGSAGGMMGGSGGMMGW